MPVGALRYGRTISDQYGENIEWRHWCVFTFLFREEVNSVQGAV